MYDPLRCDFHDKCDYLCSHDCWKNEMVEGEPYEDELELLNPLSLKDEELERLAEEHGWNKEFEYYGDE